MTLTPPASTATSTAHAEGSVPPDSEAAVPSRATRSIWHRPVSYRAQCWVAWVGLTAFGARGVAAMVRGDGTDVERVAALVLSLAWGIDLLRARSSET